MKKYTKEQVAQKLGIQTYIMDAWEKHFEIEPSLEDGKKIYTSDHLSQLNSIKELLYEKGLALDAAKRYFKDQTTFEGTTTLLAASPLQFKTSNKQPSELQIPSAKTSSEVSQASPKKIDDTHLKAVKDKLISVREHLLKISNSL